MAVALVGSVGNKRAVNVTSTTATLGQTPTSGNLLIAVTSGIATTATASLAVTYSSGWTSFFSGGVLNNPPSTNSSHNVIDIAYRIADGTETNSNQTMTISNLSTSNSAINITMYELSGANTASPQDTTGSFSSGSSSGAFDPMTATTTGNVSAAGEFAIAGGTSERGGSNTSTDSFPAGWTQASDDGATNSIAHTNTGYLASPTSGSTLSVAITQSQASSSAHCAAAIVVINSGTAAALPSGETSPGTAFLNVFGPISHSRKEAVLYDFYLQFAGSYVTAGDIAFNAITTGIQLIPVNDPQQALFSPAWLNIFQPYVSKNAVLFDTEPPTFSGTYLTSSDIVFGATSTGTAVSGSTGPAQAKHGPAWLNQFQHTRGEKYSVLFDQYIQGSNAGQAPTIAFGAITVGVVQLPQVPATDALPGPAWYNYFGHLTKYPVYYDGSIAPFVIPASFTCLGGSEVDANMYGGTAMEQNFYGGTAAEQNFYGGSIIESCTPQVLNLTLDEFNDEVLDVTILNNGQPFNLANYTINAIFKDVQGAPDSDPNNLILSNTNFAINVLQPTTLGQIVINIPHSQLQDTGSTFWRLDVVLNNQISTVVYGSVSIQTL